MAFTCYQASDGLLSTGRHLIQRNIKNFSSRKYEAPCLCDWPGYYSYSKTKLYEFSRGTQSIGRVSREINPPYRKRDKMKFADMVKKYRFSILDIHTLRFRYFPELDAIIPADQGGFMLGKEEFLELVTECMKFYDTLSDEEIQEMNTQVEQLRNRSTPPSKVIPAKRHESGFVYLIKGDAGYYKIGKARDVQKRMKNFLSLPFTVELIHTIPSNDYSQAEENLHEKFSDSRVNGEWFLLTENDVDWIKSLQRLDF